MQVDLNINMTNVTKKHNKRLTERYKRMILIVNLILQFM
jgi:hypothetical protein